MEIVDAQIHEPRPPKPLGEQYDEQFQLLVNIEIAREAIDSVGVETALIFARREYCEAAVDRYPDRFGGAVPFDTLADAPNLEEEVAAFRKRPGMVAIRNSPGNHLTAEIRPEFLEGKFERLYAACEEHGVPLFFSTHGHADKMASVAEAHPGLTMVIDHLGLSQSPVSPPRDDPWDRLDGILSIAKYPNVFVKFSGAPTLSREPFPHKDLWPNLHKIIDAFTPDRLFWGSDYTRMRWRPAPEGGDAPRSEWRWYSDALNYLRDTDELSAEDKEKILGGAIRRALSWPKVPEGASEPQVVPPLEQPWR
jgi:L-fuconolactonase